MLVHKRIEASWSTVVAKPRSLMQHVEHLSASCQSRATSLAVRIMCFQPIKQDCILLRLFDRLSLPVKSHGVDGSETCDTFRPADNDDAVDDGVHMS